MSSDSKVTKLQLRKDRSVAISSSIAGANIDAIGFNLVFNALRNPKLATDIFRLYIEANLLEPQ